MLTHPITVRLSPADRDLVDRLSRRLRGRPGMDRPSVGAVIRLAVRRLAAAEKISGKK